MLLTKGAEVIRPTKIKEAGMWQVWGEIKVHTGFWYGNLKEGNKLQGLGVNGRIILNCAFSK